MNLKIKQFIPNDFCLSCLGCCRFAKKKSVWSPYKIEPIAQAGSYICPHLNLVDNHCQIYIERPFDCQLYPFLLNKHKGKVYLAIDKKCPFAQEARNEAYLAYLMKFFKTPEVKSFLKQNPRIVHVYKDKEVENLHEI